MPGKVLRLNGLERPFKLVFQLLEQLPHYMDGSPVRQYIFGGNSASRTHPEPGIGPA